MNGDWDAREQELEGHALPTTHYTGIPTPADRLYHIRESLRYVATGKSAGLEESLADICDLIELMLEDRYPDMEDHDPRPCRKAVIRTTLAWDKKMQRR